MDQVSKSRKGSAGRIIALVRRVSVHAGLFSEPMARPTEDDALVVKPRRVGAIGAAVERSYAAHYRDIYRYVLALTRSSADAEEVTSEVFERALRSWRDEPEHVERWLMLAARRLATDRWRRARRLIAILPRLRSDRKSERVEDRSEFWSWFEAVSRALTQRQREVLVLRYGRDLTDADIAVILGLSESGVRSLASRALQALRSHPELLE